MAAILDSHNASKVVAWLNVVQFGIWTLTTIPQNTF